MRSRDELMERLAAGERNNVLDGVAPELIIEVLLDIRDLLTARNRTREIIVDRVPPDYGKENQLVGKGKWKCPGCGSVLSLGTRHRCPGPRRRR